MNAEIDSSSSCPSLTSLRDWLDERLQFDRNTIDHLSTCSVCKSALEHLTDASEFADRQPIGQSSFNREADFVELRSRFDRIADDFGSRSVNHSHSIQPTADTDRVFQIDQQTFQGQESLARDSEFDLAELQARLPDSRYRLQRIIGRGGSGIVVLALDSKLTRQVAIKFLLRETETDRQRLRREGRVLAEIDHPNVVRLLDMGELKVPSGISSTMFLVMEFVSGGSASELAITMAGKYRELSILVAGVANGLHAAHQRGLVHRDVKPSNLLFDAENHCLKIADFGLAKFLGDAATQVTRTGTILGTPEYMSPEQVTSTFTANNSAETNAGSDAASSPRTDIYSLGASLYALLTGRPPLVGNTISILRQIADAAPVAPRVLSPHIPRDLETICLHAMEKSPARRYDSMQAFAQDLQRFARGQPILAQEAGQFRKALDWCTRNRALAATLVLFIASLIAGICGTSVMWYMAARNAQQATQHAVSLEQNRERLRQSVSRFQQRVFADEALHWQMTDAFRSEMFDDVLSYLDEFSSLAADSATDPQSTQQIGSDYLMIAQAAMNVGAYTDAERAADRAVQLSLSLPQIAGEDELNLDQLFFRFQAARTACLSRLPKQNAIQRDPGSRAANDAGVITQAQSLLAAARSSFESAAHQLVLDDDLANDTDREFRWRMAERQLLSLSLQLEESLNASQIERARELVAQSLAETETNSAQLTATRALEIQSIGRQVAWNLILRLPLQESLQLFEQLDRLDSHIRNLYRTLGIPLTESDWQQGSVSARKAILQHANGEVETAIKTSGEAVKSLELALEMRSQNRTWIEELIRFQLLQSQWLVESGDLVGARNTMIDLLKRKLRLSKSSPEDYQQKKQVVQLFVKLADLSRLTGNVDKAREEYYIAAQDCRLIFSNAADRDWVLQVRPWLIAQVIQLDEDHQFQNGPLTMEPNFVSNLEALGYDATLFWKVLKDGEQPPRPNQLQPEAIEQAIMQ